MPLSSLPAAILSHMIAIDNVSPPPLRKLPSLKMPKNINYGQLDVLCCIRGKYGHSHSMLATHEAFMAQYPKIFLHKEPRLPKIFKPVEERKLRKETRESQQHLDDSHNIAVHVRKARGGSTLYGEKYTPEVFAEFLDIVRKLPIERTAHEHNVVWKMLKTIPELTSQLKDEHLRTLSKNIISETWIKGSTVYGNDGFYIILKGQARPCIKVYKNLLEDTKSTTSLPSHSSFIFDEDFPNCLLSGLYVPSHDIVLGQLSTFGSLKITPEMELEIQSVVTEDNCEILKIPEKEYEKLKLEKVKSENLQKLKLIRKCPYYMEWPTLSIYVLIPLLKWKKFPPGHVIVKSGNIISFVAYIHSGYCNIYRSIIGIMKLQTKKVKKIRKLVYMGTLKKNESFGEISVLLQVPFPCTVIAGTEVEVAIIEDKDILGKKLDQLTQQLMIQTAKTTFDHLTEEDVKNEYLKKTKQKEWKQFKDKTMKNCLFYNGIIPGFGKWNHHWTSIPRNLKDPLIIY
ncbi:cyclic nucleotide-binding domain-containing protein 1 [Marmota monax]|uniref:cyclic nucleotide-binding domain-containing protein 1 n=1 Tax=Marmota monax TaxID=9995 RepID=UPI001EAFD6DB|nr:cyclic nucleotide-binding domain-containing protein 1 [Marmota monax]